MRKSQSPRVRVKHALSEQSQALVMALINAHTPQPHSDLPVKLLPEYILTVVYLCLIPPMVWL